MKPARKVVLYIAMSLDGFIAGPNDDLSFLSRVEQEGEDYGYGEFVGTVDTVILGRKTYDWVMQQVQEFPHADKEAYILTRTPRPPVGTTTFYNGNVRFLIEQLKSSEGKTIFIDGGADTVCALLEDKLIDEFVISVIPVLLGNGVRLFREGLPSQSLSLRSAKSFPKGLVQLTYVRLEE